LTHTVFPVIIWGVDRVAEELEAINRTLADIRDRMPMPENRITKVLKVFVLVAGALAILNSADIIRAWITGG